MKILNVEPEGYTAEAREILLSLGELEERACDRDALLAAVGDVEVLIVRLAHRIDEAVFARARSLRVIVSATTGLNHIDLEAAERHGVTVLCLRGQRAFLDSVTATAEHTWGLLIALARHLLPAATSVTRGEWDRDRFRGTQLSRKTLGIVGFGRLGSIVADYARAFRMQVVFHDPYVESADADIEKLALDDLLARSDVVSLHAAYSDATRGLIGAREFERMKPTAVLINTARGEIVDEAALLNALKTRQIAGAAIDVLDNETSLTALASHPLIRFAAESDRLIVTPHVGGATLDSMKDAEVFMAQMLANYVRGEVS